MDSKQNKKLVFLVTCLFFSLILKAQESVTVEKIKINCFDTGYGYKLVIKIVKSDTVVYESPKCGYNLNFVSSLDDSIKNKVTEMLLAYETDTSLCVKAVHDYSGMYTTGEIKNRHYTLSIDALFMINYLWLNGDAILYSPIPVILNKTTGQIEKYTKKVIKELYKLYNQWLIRRKAGQFLRYDFLRNSQYSWIHSISN